SPYKIETLRQFIWEKEKDDTKACHIVVMLKLREDRLKCGLSTEQPNRASPDWVGAVIDLPQFKRNLNVYRHIPPADQQRGRRVRVVRRTGIAMLDHGSLGQLQIVLQQDV